MSELVEKLRNDGEAVGLCRLFKHKLQGDLSVEQLVNMFIKGIDFCVSNNYPTLDFMRSRFKGISEPYGAFVDDEIQGLRNKPDVILNGSCKAFLEYDGYSVCRVVSRHDTEGAVNVSGHAYVTIDVFDRSKLVICTSGNECNVMVNVYGIQANVECIGQGIKFKVKNNKTY